MEQFLVIFIGYFFPAVMVGIILYDFFTMKIPNGLNILLFFGFLGLALMIDMPLPDIGWHLLAAFIVLAAGIAAFAFNLFGGGDAKAIAAATAWFGWNVDAVIFILLTGILGGVLAVVLLLVRRLHLSVYVPTKFSHMKWFETVSVPKAHIPYGVAIGISGLIMYSPINWPM